MWAVVRCSVVVGLVGLMAASVGAETPPDDRSLFLAIAIRKAEESQLQLEELKMTFRKVMSDYAELQSELEEKEQAVQRLTNSLASVKGESQQARLKLATPVVGSSTNLASRVIASDQQLADAVAALGRAESERLMLAEELGRSNAVLDQALHGELSPVQRAQALMQIERSKRLLAARTVDVPIAGTAKEIAVPTAISLESGKVLNLNRSLQLAVINLGEKHGVRLGMPFLVVRGNRVIGHLKVVEVRAKISGAVIEQTDRQFSIQIGDRVSLTKS